MDDEKREIYFPLPDEGGTDTAASPAAIEEARAKMKSNLEHIVGGIVQNFSIVHELVETIRPALENFARMAQEVSATMNPIVEAVQQVATSFARAIADFQIPTITEERKQELIASYQKWGEYGWTLSPDAPFDCFDELPASIEAANAAMIPLCSKHEMEQLFEELHGQRIKKEDLDAAILCYNKRQYKACALILFSIIDAKLIRKQKRDTKYRPSGSKAAKKLREQFESGNNEKMLFTMLHCVNLFACLEILFANADDFKIEPATINRNFVTHGMTRRPVRQRDCIQLFLALYNRQLLPFLCVSLKGSGAELLECRASISSLCFQIFRINAIAVQLIGRMCRNIPSLPVQNTGTAVDTDGVCIDFISADLRIRIAEKCLHNISHVLLVQIPSLIPQSTFYENPWVRNRNVAKNFPVIGQQFSVLQHTNTVISGNAARKRTNRPSFLVPRNLDCWDLNSRFILIIRFKEIIF